jgi:hypothetical protein
MDHGPMLYRSTSVVAGENAAPNRFANLFLKQDGEPAEVTNLGINSQDRPWRRVADECVPMLGVKVISPHRPEGQRATKYDSLLLAHVWTNCTRADKC